jgi:salicylate hydroxylase
MEDLPDDYVYSHRQAVKSLRVIVVGAGIAGLSAGLALSRYSHSVTILESSTQLGETGAGIQLAPNATRILHRLGVLAEVMLHTSVLSGVSIRYASHTFRRYFSVSPIIIGFPSRLRSFA